MPIRALSARPDHSTAPPVYAKKQKRDEILHQFTDALTTASAALASLGQTLPAFVPADTRDKTGPMAVLGKKLTDDAASAVGVISADLASSLDLKLTSTQQQVASAVEAAKLEMEQGLTELTPWTTASSIADVLTPEVVKAMQMAIDAAKEQVVEAKDLQERSEKDNKFRLKAIAAAWHQNHAAGPIETCPICEESLKDKTKLAEDLEALRSAGVSVIAEQERAARLNLERQTAPRRLSPQQAAIIVGELRSHPCKINIGWETDADAMAFGQQLVAVFHQAGCSLSRASLVTVMIPTPVGVHVNPPNSIVAEALRKASVVIADMRGAPKFEGGIKLVPDDVVSVHVGLRPPSD